MLHTVLSTHNNIKTPENGYRN